MSCCLAAVLAEGIHFPDISPSLHSPLITTFLMFIRLFLVLLSGSFQIRKKGLLPMLLQAQVPTCFPCVPREILWPFELSLPMCSLPLHWLLPVACTHLHLLPWTRGAPIASIFDLTLPYSYLDTFDHLTLITAPSLLTLEMWISNPANHKTHQLIHIPG